MKIPLWQLQVMIAIAKSAGANDNWVIDFGSNESGRGFLLTAPALVEPDVLVTAAA